MGVDGLIFLDNNGRPIIQSGFRSTTPAYPLLHIDAVNNAISKAPRPEDVDPVVHVSAYNIDDSPGACCHVQCADMRILCPISGNGKTLMSYINVAGANINTTINSGSGLGAAGGAFSSPIPWRKAGLRYASNEIYFDMVEKLKAVVNRNGVSLASTVVGKIETNSRLSGTPDCLLSFTNPQVLADCAFHPCIRLNRWSRDKTFSFVPPDGKFILAEYRYSPNPSTSATGSSAPPTVRDNVPIPFVLKPNFDIEDQTVSFDVTLTSRLNGRSLENLVIELNLGEGASGIKCVAGRGTGGLGRGGIGAMDVVGGSSGASWAFDSRKKVLKWEIINVPPSSSWNLRGSFSTPIVPRPSHALQVKFEIQSYTFSSLKVEQLKIIGETYKPYKGVRGRSIGDVEWRW
ncbi:AP-3 complex subunit mu-1 [Psilocybe cubensis]|uniref:AP-3 complex subunit mu-1 n=1 Tax=Psilocybe cubensis TaxID=181762 RepID=A0ACB8H5B7_PSICU|nr:AP-3 complex subunit mu-1 [Psilocybe cubensis]KAH9482902.1 AP-3 complex subunit mu-1 [Psilocybe cubensis]